MSEQSQVTWQSTETSHQPKMETNRWSSKWSNKLVAANVSLNKNKCVATWECSLNFKKKEDSRISGHGYTEANQAAFIHATCFRYNV